MNAGKLINRIMFKKPTEVQAGSGGTTATYSTLASCWASIEDLSGKELIQAGQMGAIGTVRVRCRYVPGVTNECRIVAGNRTLEIFHVNNVENRNAELEMLCRESK